MRQGAWQTICSAQLVLLVGQASRVQVNTRTAGAINTVKAVNGEIVRKTQEELSQEKASKRAGGYLGHLFEYDASKQTAASAAFDKNVYDPLVASGNLNRYIGKGMATGGTPLGPDSTSKLYQQFMQQAHGIIPKAFLVTQRAAMSQVHSRLSLVKVESLSTSFLPARWMAPCSVTPLACVAPR